ncbi:CamS family sex pheromone protein [Alkalibacillus almallahensis]|uniref:CamS family sex pheromone protein n=1 Tax=Alkalibacillus almallahensis TaxID=1379154 RepID=UPI001FB94A7F|nr:CamS family sex pheromone protein [Alkalibacillus almallahensis]
MSKWLGLPLLVLLMAACSPNFDSEEEVVQETDEEEQTEEDQQMIVSPDQLDTNDYRMVLPYQPSAARGTITNQISNRYDIDEFEQGLTRLSKDPFSPDDYLFQEGQYLDESTVFDWINDFNPERPEDLEEDLEDAQDANAEDEVDAIVDELETYKEENPRVVSHILEQNYLTRAEENRVELAGVSIGIALKSDYQFSVNYEATNNVAIDKNEMLQIGKETAGQILERVRGMEELQDVPIMLALYRENSPNASVPGSFVTKAVVEPNDMTVNEWQSLDEKTVLFPSSEAEDNHYEDSEMFTGFSQDVSDYFPNYIGVIGRGFYKDGELQELSINIPVEFHGKQEVIGFTQHASSLMAEHFPSYFDLEVTVESASRQEAVLFRDAGAEDITHHIYHD